MRRIRFRPAGPRGPPGFILGADRYISEPLTDLAASVFTFIEAAMLEVKLRGV